MEAKNLVTQLETSPSSDWTMAYRFGSRRVETPEAMTVFEFEDFRSYLVYVRDHYPGLRRPITLERWAKKLNYRSPRSIAMVLKGQRLPSEDLVLAFSQDLKHSENERRYFELLVRKEKHKDNIPASISEELSKLNPRMIKRKPLETELFSYVAEWYNYVILQLLQVPSFRSCPDADCAKWICQRMAGKITLEQVQNSIVLLEKLKLLERDSKTGFLRTASAEPLIAIDEVPSAAGRKHHMEQMDQAKEALVRQSLSEREFTTMTLRANRARLPAIKKAIREFRDKFDKDFAEDPGEDVCQLNVQFFFHTVEDDK
jgi:uncharacterized protein (TIGR02147 family)